jgi:hypothetical protein
VETCIILPVNRDPDFDSFDVIFSSHSSNTKQAIITAINMNNQDDVLQSLHRWPQHVGEPGPDIPRVRDY